MGAGVYQWAVENGDNRRLKIAVCGYAGQYDWPQGWVEHAWTTLGGMSQGRKQERVWFSPHCLTR